MIMATIKGTPDDDDIVGGPEADIISGLAGDDILDGRDGDDRIFGGPGDDRLEGGDGNDRLYGGTGNDDLLGAAGDDVLIAGPAEGPIGQHDLFGGTGNDTLVGGDGNDFLNGGLGVDQMTGGAGSDTFEFRAAGDDYDSGVGKGNRDAITDFSPAEGDKIDVSGIDADRSNGGGTLEDFVFAGEAEIGTLDTTEIGFFETGGVTIVHANTDAGQGSSFEIQLRGVGLGLDADDFLL